MAALRTKPREQRLLCRVHEGGHCVVSLLKIILSIGYVVFKDRYLER